MTGERPPRNGLSANDLTRPHSLPLREEALSHLERGRATVRSRIARRARGWAMVHGMFTTATLLLLLPPLTVRFGITLAVLQAIGVLAGGSVFFVSMRGERRRFHRHIDESWERSTIESPTAAADTKSGLIVSAASVLEMKTIGDGGFSAAMLQRFLSVPLPSPTRLQIVLPGASPRLVSGTTATLLLVMALGPSLTHLSSLWGGEGSVSSRASSSRPSESPQTERSASHQAQIHSSDLMREEVARLRTELSQREELARWLEGVPELAPLVEVLRNCGVLPDLGPLSMHARERLQRAIRDARRRGVPPAATEALASLLRSGGTPSPSTAASPLFHWEDAARRLSEIARGWEQGEGTAGTAELSVPKWADGGTTSSTTTVAPRPIGESEIETPTVNDPLTLTEGLPIAPGDRVDPPPQISTQEATIDRTETWLRRPDLEPSWFPAIEAYRRLRAHPVPDPPQPPRKKR